MFTWISKTTAIATAATGLAACSITDITSRNAADTVRLPSGVIVEGSPGWCVAPDMLHTADDVSVVVFGSCAAIEENASLPSPDVSGIITVSVDNVALGTTPSDVLEAFFGTEKGRAALARDGQADSVQILESLQDNDALFLHAVDQSGWPADAAEDYWRAVFDIGGRFVTVSLVGLNDEPIARDVGLRTLEAQIEKLRAANPDRA